MKSVIKKIKKKNNNNKTNLTFKTYFFYSVLTTDFVYFACIILCTYVCMPVCVCIKKTLDNTNSNNNNNEKKIKNCIVFTNKVPVKHFVSYEIWFSIIKTLKCFLTIQNKTKQKQKKKRKLKRKT